MSFSLLTDWANGIGAIVAAPSVGKQALGWVGGEQPPADWENWLNQTQIEAINDLNVNAWDVVRGGTWASTGETEIDYSGYTGITNPALLIQGAPNMATLGIVGDYSEFMVGFSNVGGVALYVEGDTSSPIHAPFQMSPIDDDPSSPNDGEIWVKDSFFDSISYRSSGQNYTLVQNESQDQVKVLSSASAHSGNEALTGGPIYWQLVGSAWTVQALRVYLVNDMPLYYPLNNAVPNGAKITEIRADVIPGGPRPVTTDRMTVYLFNTAALLASNFDDGTSNFQTIAVTAGSHIYSDNDDYWIEIRSGKTNQPGNDFVFKVEITFDMPIL